MALPTTASTTAATGLGEQHNDSSANLRHHAATTAATARERENGVDVKEYSDGAARKAVIGGTGEVSAIGDGERRSRYAEYNSKKTSEYLDPCQDAADRSIRCLRRNPGRREGREMCSDYFQAYRDCKKAWMEALQEERRKRFW